MHKKLDVDEHNSKNELTDENTSSYIQSIIRSRLSDRQSISLLDHAPICIIILDPNFNLQYLSPAGIKSLNIDDIANFYDKPYPFSFYSKSFRDGMFRNLTKAVKTDTVVTHEASAVDLKGNKLWFHSTIIPIQNGKDQIESILVISIDSTACKKAEIALSKINELHVFKGAQFQMEYSNKSSYVNFTTKVTNIILANISDNNFNVNALAKHLFMSRSTLQRK